MDIKESISDILRWNKFHALAMLLAAGGSLSQGNTLILAFIAFPSFIYFLILNKKILLALKPLGGYANWVTTFRLFIIHFLIAFWYYFSTPFFVSMLVLFVCLDGLDGKLARKYKQCTVFGEYYDMELDALFVLFASLVLFFKGIAGMWILIPGVLRYVFVIYTWVFSVKPKKDEKQRFATVIAGFFLSC